MYRRKLVVLGLMCLALPVFGVQEKVGVVEGTIRRIDSGTKTVVIATKDGAEQTFRFAGRTTVHGFKTSETGAKDAIHGLREGSDVVVHYTTRGTVDTAQEIDHIGSDGLKVVDGTVRRIDRGAKTITIATAEGTEKTFTLLDHAVLDAGKDIGAGAEKTTKVTVYYTDEAGKKIAHFFKRSS